MARNPFRSEAEAYRFLLLTVGYFALIVVAALDQHAGSALAVFVAADRARALALDARRAAPEPPRTASVRRASGEDERRILVIANETVGGDDAPRRAAREGRGRARAGARRLSRRSTRRCGTGPRTRTAPARPRRSGSTRASPGCRELGIDARGEVGDGDPLQAMEDALRTFGADEIVISTHPEGRSHWLERGVVSAARERFDVPITHVVVDLEAEARTSAVRGPSSSGRSGYLPATASAT